MSRFFCGCCGEVEVGDANIWCKPCEEHVLPAYDILGTYIHFWDRTFQAIHGQPCPNSGS